MCALCKRVVLFSKFSLLLLQTSYYVLYTINNRNCNRHLRDLSRAKGDLSGIPRKTARTADAAAGIMLKSQCRSRPFVGRLFSSIPREIRGVIVSETRIGNYKSCVRVWDTSGQRFWSPLQDIHSLNFWNRGQWKVGQSVLIEDGIPSDAKFPHATEDIYGHVTAQIGPLMTDSAIYNMLNPFAKTITNGGIDLGLSHTMYAEENEKHPSLFLVRTSSDSYVERDYLDTLRFENAECGAYGVPVVSVELMFNQGVTQVPAGSLIMFSLARGWEGSRSRPFPTKRCYLMVGGIIPPPGEVLRKESPPFPATKVVKLAKRGGKVVQDCDVYIGRAINQGGWSLPTSKWHNPFKRANDTREAKIAAIAQFEEHLLQLLRDLPELRGKTLGCWCKTHPDVPCHGDVLKHYAECLSC